VIDSVTERENLARNYAERAYEARLHTADPGTTGANEVTGGDYARLTITWNYDAADGTVTSNDLAFQVPAATDVAYVSLWRQDGTYMDKGEATATFVNAGIHHVVLTYTQE
jgi:hypothetical protein